MENTLGTRSELVRLKLFDEMLFARQATYSISKTFDQSHDEPKKNDARGKEHHHGLLA